MKTLFINGKWEKAKGPVFSSLNPATGKMIWEGGSATAADIDLAVHAARKALISWHKTPLKERMAYIESFKEHLEKEKEELAKTISKETGKVLWECLEEVQAMIGKIAISQKAFEERCPSKTLETPIATARLRHKPHGVMAVFGPFNFPGHIPNGHIIPALIAGNCCIFKPSEETPLTAMRILEIWEKSGIPDGVIQLVQGETETGVALSNHDGIDGLLFTGSGKVGQLLAEAFVKKPGKILALELGGNNPLIAMEVNDYKAAAYTTLLSAYATTGQRCTCARRLIVPDGEEGERLLSALKELLAHTKVGSPDETPEPFMGPLINYLSAENFLDIQEKLIKKGGKPLLKMELKEPGLPFVTPGLIDVTMIHDREDLECFAPFLQVIRVKNFEEACREANHTAYGLSSGILTDNKKLFDAYLDVARAGIVNWNTPLTGASSAMPFGGWGKSGNFRPSAYYAADYCSYPVASMESEKLSLPEKLKPGISLNAQV